jgi:hypothetical protein
LGFEGGCLQRCLGVKRQSPFFRSLKSPFFGLGKVACRIALNNFKANGAYICAPFLGGLLKKIVSSPIFVCSKIRRHENLAEFASYNSLTSTF